MSDETLRALGITRPEERSIAAFRSVTPQKLLSASTFPSFRRSDVRSEYCGAALEARLKEVCAAQMAISAEFAAKDAACPLMSGIRLHYGLASAPSATPASGGSSASSAPRAQPAPRGPKAAASSGGGSAPRAPTAPYVERISYPLSDIRSSWNFNGKLAGMDKERKRRLSPSALQEEEGRRPAMHALICNIIVLILMSRYSADEVERIFCDHAGIEGPIFAHLERIHRSDPNWHPAKWVEHPQRAYILVAQAIYDDASPLSFPKKLSTYLLARLSANQPAITAFVDGIFPPPPVSAVTSAVDPALQSASAASQDISAAGGAYSLEASPEPAFEAYELPCCFYCGRQLNLDFSCEPCSMVADAAARQLQHYNDAAAMAVAAFLAMYPTIPCFF